MTDFITSGQDPSLPEITEAAAMRLLRMGMRKSGKGVDLLIERLLQGDGEFWMARMLRQEPFASTVGDPESALLRGSVTLVQLQMLKERAKLAGDNADPQMRVGARAAYDFAIAAAIVHFGKKITTQRPEHIRDSFTELGDVMPEPWKGLFRRAVDRALSSTAV